MIPSVFSGLSMSFLSSKWSEKGDSKMLKHFLDFTTNKKYVQFLYIYKVGCEVNLNACVF